MSNRDGFGSGFWLGTLVGGIIGGVVGATIVDRRANRIEDDADSNRLAGASGEKRPFKSSRNRTTDRMEVARQSLDHKISDLNNAIDSVRSSISNPSSSNPNGGEAIDVSLERLNQNISDTIKPQSPIEAEG
jgi:gas vesicle protein